MSITLNNTAAEFKTAIGLGDSADLNVGTGANNLVQLDSNGKLPAVDASALTGNMYLNNTPYFSAYATSNTTVANTTWLYFTSATFGITTEFDTHSAFDASTGRFTPQKAGYYYVKSQFHFDAGGGQLATVYVDIHKNGTLYHQSEIQEQTSNANEASLIATALVEMNGTTDYLETRSYVNDGNGSPLLYGGIEAGTNNGHATMFMAYRIAAL
jgi:hypothetical protein